MPASPKGYYTPTLSHLLHISLSTGLVAWFSLFLLPLPSCNPVHSQLQILLSLIAILFLLNTLTFFLLSVLLRPFNAYSLVFGWHRHLLNCGIGIMCLFLGTGLILVAITIEVTLRGSGATGKGRSMAWLGISLLAILALSIVYLSFTTEEPDSSDAAQQDELRILRGADEIPELGARKVISLGILYLLQFVCLIVLLSMGGKAAVNGTVAPGCHVSGAVPIERDREWTTSHPLPVDIVAGRMVESVQVNVVITITACSETGTGMASAEAEGEMDGLTSIVLINTGGLATAVDRTSVATTAYTTVHIPLLAQP